ncbi:hypothetical protein VNO80_22550 [Phaseolus coccineus]|uniref:Uncharacterized protein n=1 Tax=Phaseolus coccineus TaxID=3886 RepID=A0AAN9QU49_PHACN
MTVIYSRKFEWLFERWTQAGYGIHTLKKMNKSEAVLLESNTLCLHFPILISFPADCCAGKRWNLPYKMQTHSRQYARAGAQN